MVPRVGLEAVEKEKVLVPTENRIAIPHMSLCEQNLLSNEES
jgi:hypothetical protein